MFTVANDSEVNDLAAGVNTGHAVPWRGRRADSRVPMGYTGVLWKESLAKPGIVKPVALVVHDADRQRLFGRFSQLRGDLSPLSTWCHVLTPQRLEMLDGTTRMPDLGGFEAAWAGLIVAEAVVLAGAPPSKLKTYSCFATQSWAIARTRSLWPKMPVEEICDRLYAARRLTRGDETRLGRLRQPFQSVWSILAAASDGGPIDHSLQPLVAALQALSDVRAAKDEPEIPCVVRQISMLLPEESRLLNKLPSMGPEERLDVFDFLVDQLAAERSPRTQVRSTALAFMAGYIATIAAGGSASLSLATNHAHDHPQIAAWAYALGGVGEHVTWTTSFDGLGRLVARELLRPFRLEDQPDCDFALDEGEVLADSALSDPLVHLRIKQGRTLAVTIYPGVNVTVPLAEQLPDQQADARPASVKRAAAPNTATFPGGDEALALLTEMVWARLAPRLQQEREAVQSGQGQRLQRSGGNKRSGKGAREPSLPFTKAPR
jgi:hypothetical protein